jgi:asparagine synthase (glutamine-hydrolysing)
MGLRLLRTTPESLAEDGPFRDPEQDQCLVFDGRVDNRDELARDLRAAGCEPRGATDAELVLRAWQAWHEDAPRRILGDFAFALWDGRRRVLFCARDIIGVRPFNYHCGPRHFLFGSELRQMFCDPAVPETLNEGMIGEHLAFAITSEKDTFFSGIHRLPRAHWMSVGLDGRVRLQRYWDIDFSLAIRHPQPEDYARHLRELLEQSVRCRLRSSGPIGIDLSGGMDSSTVCALAHKLGGGERGGALHAFSATYPGLVCDESPYILAAARQAGIEPILLPNQEAAESYFEQLAVRYRDFPGYPVADSFFGTVAPAAAQRGCRVFFSGSGGNEWFTGEAASLADAMLELDPVRLLQETRWVAAWEEISPGRAFLRHAVRPWLRQAARASGLRQPNPPELPWLMPAWVARIDLQDRMRAVPEPPPGGSRAQAVSYGWTLDALNAHGYEMGDRLTFGAGVEYRHPLLDRRLIEFSFAVPPALHFSGGLSKSLLRAAMRDLLPAQVLERRGGADFSIVTSRVLDRVLARHPAAAWTAARTGWVEPGALMAAYAAARDGLNAGTSYSGSAVWRTWMAYATGVTLDALRTPQARRIADHQA